MGVDYYRNTRVSTPDGLHARSSRPGYVHLGVVTHKDSSSRGDVESLQRTEKDPAIWFADALGVGNQDGIKQRQERQAFQLATLHSNRAIRNQPEPQA